MTSAILIHRNNQQTGPFPEAQVRQMLADGRLAATDLAWRQGMPEWKPLSEVLAAPAATAASAKTQGAALKWGLAAGGAALVLALGGVGAWQYAQQQKIAAEQQRLALEQQRLAEDQARAEEQRRQEEEKKKAEEEMQRLAEEKRQAEEKNRELEERLAEEKRAAERERQHERTYRTPQRQVSDSEFATRGSMNSPYAGNPAPVCRECGVVQSVRAVTHEGQGSGLGAVAGGVVGGVLGNQVGRGRGRDAATVVGALGGAYAGHQIEKSQRTTTSYEITVRFDDGSVRVFNQEQQPYWRQGDRVRINNGVLAGY